MHEEAAEGVPLQKLASLSEVPAFDLQQWLDAQPVPNQVNIPVQTFPVLHACSGCRTGQSIAYLLSSWT